MPSIDVVSIAGNILFTAQLGQGDSLAATARQAAVALGTVSCKLASADGVPIAYATTMERADLRDGALVTAVGMGKAPLVVSSRRSPGFAAVGAGGAVVTWGRCDSSAVRSKNKAECQRQVRRPEACPQLEYQTIRKCVPRVSLPFLRALSS